MMRRLYTAHIALIITAALFGCKKDEIIYTPPPPTPEITLLEPINEGADLRMVWTSVEEAEWYYVYCGSWEHYERPIPYDRTTDTEYVFYGDRVCKQVGVAAVKEDTLYGSDEFHLEPELRSPINSFSLRPSYHLLKFVPGYGAYNAGYDLNGPWIRIDFRTSEVKALMSDQVSYMPQTAYFLICDIAGCGNNTFRDVSSYVDADFEIAFSEPDFGFLAPPTGYYSTIRQFREREQYFFWADNLSHGYNEMDTSDYFGYINLFSIYYLDSAHTKPILFFEVIIQDMVKGLRWLPPWY